LLYDFLPLYFGMNLGSSGFSTHHNLKDFTLLSKTGQVIDGEDFVVSVLRNKAKPLVFKVLAFNLELREEFMMELSEADIYELVEGD
jgi:NifB/MoaA-like Fe-S oxidoreductase